MKNNLADAFEVLEKMGKEPARSHQLVYDSSSSTLEPIYFWILNFMNNLFGGKTEKLVDNFSSSPGSAHFTEMGQRKTIMQDNVMKTLGAVNQVTKSMVNLIYDLKDFEIRLKHYEDVKSKDRVKKEGAMLALKQIWLDNVDIKRGVGSIHQMTAGNLNFVTLRDAFLAASSPEEVEKMDLNDRVKRILKPRLAEFYQWTTSSESELTKRFNIEKNYLKSQVNTLQLYTRWVKPYLKAATELEMKEKTMDPELVTAFNTIVLELALIGKNEINIEDAILERKLPQGTKKPKRGYFSCVIIKFHFRGIPQKAGQSYLFGGRATVEFKGYALNNQEIELFQKEMKDSDIEDAMKLIEGSTTESLDEIKKDIDHFLEGGKEEEEKEKRREKEDINPFKALFSGLWPKRSDKKDKKEIKDIKDIKKDNYVEGEIRKLAAKSADELCFNVYDVYKKAHKMASHDSPFE
ncbi:hypothetical protein J4477_02340 [Candidatus Pacearchaeota archaeon]|nr:hypothetical protein [Candidatus Pacearchaeota archaeon]